MLIKNINFYTIVDTNWLMNQEKMEIHFAKAPYYSPFDILKRHRQGTVIFPMCIIIPKQVKSEILSLSKREDKDYVKIARAKKHYTHLLRYFNSDVEPYVFTEGSMVYSNMKSRLLTMREFDLDKVPRYSIRERELGPDSPTDKGIMSLAYSICKFDRSAHCFVATYDTGMQVEIAHLFFRENMRIGCYQIINDWKSHLISAANKLLTDEIYESIKWRNLNWMNNTPRIEVSDEQECQCQC